MLGKEKSQDIYRAISLGKSMLVRFLDLQYQSIIKCDNYFLIPLNILIGSNFIRNSLYLTRKRIFESTGVDTLTKLLKKVLEDNCDYVDDKVDYKYKTYSGDLDLIAKKDSSIFVFECKNTLYPGNVPEARTTYDHLQKAAEQLNKIVHLFKDNDFRKYLSNKLGWSIENNDKLSTCIVLGNRMYSGLIVDGHPVRGIYELANYIDTGDILVQGGVLNQWRADSFTSEDLIRYLSQGISDIK